MICLSVNCNLPFFHHFKQRGLRFCRGAVDLIDQHDVAENGTWPELEDGILWIEYRSAGNITRHEVGCELDTRKAGRY